MQSIDATDPRASAQQSSSAKTPNGRSSGNESLERSAGGDDSKLKFEWRPGDAFDADAFEAALERPTIELKAPKLGIGHGWEIPGEFNIATAIEIYPGKPALFLSSATGPNTSKTRIYVPQYLCLREDESGVSVTIEAEEDGIQTTVSISASGEVEEVRQACFDKVKEIVEHDLMTVAEAAEVIGCSQRNVKYLLRVGHLPWLKRGNLNLIDAESVRSYQRSNRGPGKARTPST